MNCVKDDIARIVFIHPAVQALTGRFVKLVEPVVCKGMPGWLFEHPVRFVATGFFSVEGRYFEPGDQCSFIALQDRFLRPIRDQEGTDEMLREAGLPKSLVDPAANPQREMVL